MTHYMTLEQIQKDKEYRAQHLPTIENKFDNCKYAPRLAYVLATNPNGMGKVMLHPAEVERFILNSPFFSVSSVLVWDDPMHPHNMHNTNATATLSKWNGTRHVYSIGYEGASGRVTWWENLDYATTKHRIS